eukprot:TRINITY_DN8502_c0_g2_i1.p1 TRINITY_DN8502_c0_g2~~TRINITY_DN8502_c0_g2_i1.p1  ORF type:complete len:1020 (+),score=339.73 TRINITY_DN8502_c0_g2_i1:453-3062(+)
MVTPESGMFLRALQDLLSYSVAHREQVQLHVGFSVIEVYGDHVHDLLGKAMRRLRIVVTDQKVRVPDATHALIRDARDVWCHYQRAMARRHTRSTAANAASSRSHAILVLTAVQQRRPSQAAAGPLDTAVREDPGVIGRLVNARDEVGTPIPASADARSLPPRVAAGAQSVPLSAASSVSGGGPVIVSQLVLADLAGSERGSRSNLQPGSDGFQEMVSINGSLTALGNVVRALHQRQGHVPYRESRLTALLRPSLSPEGRVSVVICCSPTDATPTSQTLSSLYFADKVKGLRAVRGTPEAAEARMEEPYLHALRTHDTLAAEMRIAMQQQPRWPLRCAALPRHRRYDSGAIASAKVWLAERERDAAEEQKREMAELRVAQTQRHVDEWQEQLAEVHAQLRSCEEESEALARLAEIDRERGADALLEEEAAVGRVAEGSSALAAHRDLLRAQLAAHNDMLQKLERVAAKRRPQTPPPSPPPSPGQRQARTQRDFTARLVGFRNAQAESLRAEREKLERLEEAESLRRLLGIISARGKVLPILLACADAAVDISEKRQHLLRQPPTPYDHPQLVDNTLLYLASGSEVLRRRNSGELMPVTLSLVSDSWHPDAEAGEGAGSPGEVSPTLYTGSSPRRSAGAASGWSLCWEEELDGARTAKRISASSVVGLVLGCVRWTSDDPAPDDGWAAELCSERLPREFWLSFSVLYGYPGYSRPLSLDVLCHDVHDVEAWVMGLEAVSGCAPRWVPPGKVPHAAAEYWARMQAEADLGAASAGTPAAELALCAANWLPRDCVTSAAKRVFRELFTGRKGAVWGTGGLPATKGELRQTLGLDIFRACALWDHMQRRGLLVDPLAPTSIDPLAPTRTDVLM